MQVIQPLIKSTAMACLSAYAIVLSGCHHVESTPVTRSQLIRQAEADLQAGHLNHALAKLSRLVRSDNTHNNDDSQIHLDLGWVYLYSNRLKLCKQQLDYVSHTDPNNASIHHLKGALLARLGQPDDALEQYNQALETQSNDPRLHYDIAQAFLSLDSPDDALKAINTAIRLDPNNATYAFQYCATLRQLQRYQDASKACRQTLNLTTDPAERIRISEMLQNIALLEQLNGPPTPVPADTQPPTPDAQADKGSPAAKTLD